MGYYRPRPATTTTCQHCATPFEARHKRTIYCGESCRQLAYQARQRTQPKQEPASQVNNDLNFSMQNVGVTALGASIPALLNHILNDAPAQQEILAKLNRIIHVQGHLQAKVDRLTDIANIQLQGDYTLKRQVEQATAKRLAKAKQRLLTKANRKE